MSIPLIARACFPLWNKAALTEEQLLNFCIKNDVFIVNDTRQKFGRYLIYRGYDFILINPLLLEGWRKWVLCHEVCHSFLHYPSNFSRSMTRKADYEANFFAAIALLPKELIEGKTIYEIINETDLPIELIKIRWNIYQNQNQ